MYAMITCATCHHGTMALPRARSLATRHRIPESSKSMPGLRRRYFPLRSGPTSTQSSQKPPAPPRGSRSCSASSLADGSRRRIATSAPPNRAPDPSRRSGVAARVASFGSFAPATPGRSGEAVIARASAPAKPTVPGVAGAKEPKLATRAELPNDVMDLVRGWAAPTSLSFAESHQPGNSRNMNANFEAALAAFGTTGCSSEPTAKENTGALSPALICWIRMMPCG